MKKVISLVLALAMVLSIATSTASAFSLCGNNEKTSLLSKLGNAFSVSNIFTKKSETPAISFATILENVKKGVEGTGLVYGRDYTVTCDDNSTYGYRIHLIQPTTGVDLYDNYLKYDAGTNSWTWEKSWNIAEIPTEINLKTIAQNIYTALWDSGIYIDVDKDLSITRESEDGYKILIIDPITGREIYNKSLVITDEKTINWNEEFEPIAEDSILAAHFPTVEEATEEIVAEDEEIAEPVVEEAAVEETVETVVVDDATPLGDVEEESIAKTGDTAFTAMAAVAVLAGAAFVATKKHD